MAGGGLADEEGTGDVDVHDTAELVSRVVLGVDKVGDASGVHDDVDVAELSNNRLEDLLNALLITHIGLEEASLDTVGLVEALSSIETELGLDIEDDDCFEANRAETLGHGVTKTTGTTGDQGNLAIKTVVLQEVLGRGRRSRLAGLGGGNLLRSRGRGDDSFLGIGVEQRHFQYT